MTASSILVGVAGRVVWVRVEGKGSFLNATNLKEFAHEMTNRGYREFVVDLKNCPVMDSTFMGVLAGIALRLREFGQGRLRVIRLNERNRDFLGNLGLDQLFTVDAATGMDSESTATEALPDVAVDKETRARTMLEAHEAVVQANPENAGKFKDVLEYLREDLRKAQ